MKKCPHCGADIQENSRFCIYCMQELNQKVKCTNKQPTLKHKKWWLICFTLVIVPAVLLGFVFLSGEANIPTSTPKTIQTPSETDLEPTPSQTPSVTPTATALSTESALPTPSATPTTEPVSSPTLTLTPTPTPTSKPTAKPTSTPTPTAKPTPTPTPTPTAKPTPKPTQKPSPTPAPTATPTPAATPTPSAVVATYSYQNLTAGALGLWNPQDYNNKVIITGVSGTGTSGLYEIPSHIDGKEVYALATDAFAQVASSVKKVYIPATVSWLNSYVFRNCYNLTDIYIEGDHINICADTFQQNTTTYVASPIYVHCSPQCTDTIGDYLAETASQYGLTYIQGESYDL